MENSKRYGKPIAACRISFLSHAKLHFTPGWILDRKALGWYI